MATKTKSDTTETKANKGAKAAGAKAPALPKGKAAPKALMDRFATTSRKADAEDDRDEDEDDRDDEGNGAAEPRETRAGAPGRNKIVRSYAAIARRAQKLAATLAGSPLGKDAEVMAKQAKALAEMADDLPPDFKGKSIGTRAFVLGESVKIADRYKARFVDLVDVDKPLRVVKQVGNRVVLEQDGARIMVGYFNLRNVA